MNEKLAEALFCAGGVWLIVVIILAIVIYRIHFSRRRDE
jgi:hypothetical protein